MKRIKQYINFYSLAIGTLPKGRTDLSSVRIFGAKKSSLIEMHRAGTLFIHQPGTGFQGEVRKCRHQELHHLLGKEISLDELQKSMTFGNFPRKIKKALKKHTAKVINNYKTNF